MNCLLKPFNPKKATFGRHETFPLRYAWLTKGFQSFEADHNIFSLESATIDLGVGKNMVNAIKYWLRATSMLVDSENGLVASELGQAVFSKDGWDPYLEDEVTIWLVHWQIATNFELSSAWYWFFNCFHKAEFTSEEASNLLAEFVLSKLSGKHSERTVRNEIAMIIRMYCPPNNNRTHPEEGLDTPLATLKLLSVSEASHHFRSYSCSQPSLAVGLIGFAVNELLNLRQLDNILISELMYGERNGIALGSIFRLTESALLAKLERLVIEFPTIFQINETAGNNQLYRKEKKDSLTFLRRCYQQATHG